MKPFWQFVKFLLLGLIATVVELGVFAICNYSVFKGFSNRPFSWFLFSYPISEGGLCSFLSLVVSFTAAQITNFIVQRKYTFKSTNNVVLSSIMYLVMVVACYIYILWLPSIISSLFYDLLGSDLGALAVKLISQFTCALIQFPLNKFLVMR